MTLSTTANCKELLAFLYGGTTKEWKRESKYKSGVNTVRIFSFKKKQYCITSDAADKFISVVILRPPVPVGPPTINDTIMVVPPVERNIQLGDHPAPPPTNVESSGTDFIEEIRRRSIPITHCGDYCNVYYNVKTKALWVELGDGDPIGPQWDQEPGAITQIQRLYEGMPQVREIIVEAEHSPRLFTEEEGLNDWVQLPGKFGTMVDIDW